MPHGRKTKKPKIKQPRKRKKKVRPIDPGFGRDFRRPRQFAMRPRRAPARVLHKHTTAFMLGALARICSHLCAPPNWLTQRAPPFVPYDPWQEHRRHTRMVDARNRAQMRREIQAEQGGGAVAHAGYGQYG